MSCDLRTDRLYLADSANTAIRIINRGAVLFTEGDEPDELFVVVSGRVAIANPAPLLAVVAPVQAEAYKCPS